VILWLRSLTVGKRSYTTVIEFANVAGMQEGQWFDIVALCGHYFSYPGAALKSIWKLQLT